MFLSQNWAGEKPDSESFKLKVARDFQLELGDGDINASSTYNLPGLYGLSALGAGV